MIVPSDLMITPEPVSCWVCEVAVIETTLGETSAATFAELLMTAFAAAGATAVGLE
jgi:hypothetical protein